MSAPVYRKLDVPFADGTFPGTVTIAFEAAETSDVDPARQVTVEAGRRGNWVIEFRPGQPLPEGSRVALRKVENEFRFDWRHQDYWPQAMGYVTVEDRQGEALPFLCETALKAATPAIVTLPRDWLAGEPIIVRIGDRRFGGPGVIAWPTKYEQAHMVAGVSLPGEETFRRVPDATLTVRIVPCPPVDRYYLFAPSQAAPGEAFQAIALPVDANGNAIPGGEVAVATPGGSPAEVVAGPRHSLHISATVRDEGTARLRLEDCEHGLVALSNPVRVARAAGPGVYWGEFHCHGYDGHEINVLNEGSHPDSMYAYGRDVTRLDFVAMGSHIFRQVPDAVAEWWELYREAARRYDEEGRYVTFMGCEWRDREDAGGDRNLVRKHLDAPMPNPTWRIDDIYRLFPGQEAMVTPHVGGAIAFPCCHGPEVEWLCEMTSGHGNFEWFAQAYLQKGYRVGLIGGSDGHKGTPGHPRVVGIEGGRFFNMLRRRDGGWAGGPLLGVYAERLDRDALWQAFRRRNTYASTGARALLEFRVNEALMGAEVEAGGDVRLALRIHGTAPIERVDVIRGAQRLRRFEPGSETLDVTFVDQPPRGETYYYVRVEQADGEMLWSSPVWVNAAAGRDVAEDLPAWNAEEAVDLAAIAENEATQHLPALQEYLAREENLAAFEDLTPAKVVRSSLGDYAVFFCHVRGKRIRIHWFYGFEIPRIRLEVGWVQYGREIIKGEPWTAPLVAAQDTMG